jgi:serine/threonine protein phosphatase PrpC
MRQPAARDHEERQGPGWAGVSDKGRRHHRNEDAFGVASAGSAHLAVVVSDGVSTTHRPDEASAAAVAAALDVLAGPGAADPSGVAAPSGGADLNGAAAAAQKAVLTIASDGTPGPADLNIGPPSCTFLAAVLTDGAIEFGSLGDCRAYWLDAGGARMLTSDDSWAGEQVAAGTLTTEQAMADQRAHVITRWLGPDADPTWEPRLTHFEPPGPGRLLACSDGLWNYLSEPADVAAAVGTRTDLLDIARSLTDLANEAGGHDNITVVVVDWPVAPAGRPDPDGKDTP